MRLIRTDDGSNTLEHETLGELYHSDRGAVGESVHVFIESGLRYFLQQREPERVVILEIGFGTGLNAWLTFLEAEKAGISIEYHAIELYPLSPTVAQSMSYTKAIEFDALHNADWGSLVKINDLFSIHKHHVDLLQFPFQYYSESFDLLYFDAFSPDIQPELWSEQVFAKTYQSLTEGGILTTYTAKGALRRRLQQVGFKVERLEGALGKRHMIRAVKHGLLSRDLLSI